MRRREFITLVGGAAAAIAAPRAAYAQQTRRIGVLVSRSADDTIATMMTAFRQSLQLSGYRESQNIELEFRSADGRYEQLPALATDLVDRQVAVIATQGAPAAVAAKAATGAIPIVFAMGEDPIDLGLVESFNRPGGNVTGVAGLSSHVMAKRLELLHELVPDAGVFAALINPKNPNAKASENDAQAAARTLRLQIHILTASSAGEIETVLARLVQLQAGALLIAPDGYFNSRSEQLAALTTRYAIPASAERREFPAAGGLISYGSSNTEAFRLVGIYVARILKGEKAGDLPVQQPTKFELVINRKTADAIGLKIPPKLLAIADEVIE